MIESGKEITVTVAPGQEKVLNIDYESDEQRTVEIRSSNPFILYPPKNQDVQVVYKGKNWLNVAVKPITLKEQLYYLHCIDTNSGQLLQRLIINLKVTEPVPRTRTTVTLSERQKKQYQLVKFKNSLGEPATFDFKSSDTDVMKIVKS